MVALLFVVVLAQSVVCAAQGDALQKSAPPGGGQCDLSATDDGFRFLPVPNASQCNHRGMCTVFDLDKLIPIDYPFLQKEDEFILHGLSEPADLQKYNGRRGKILKVKTSDTERRRPLMYYVRLYKNVWPNGGENSHGVRKNISPEEKFGGYSFSDERFWVNTAFVREVLKVGDVVRCGRWLDDVQESLQGKLALGIAESSVSDAILRTKRWNYGVINSLAGSDGRVGVTIFPVNKQIEMFVDVVAKVDAADSLDKNKVYIAPDLPDDRVAVSGLRARELDKSLWTGKTEVDIFDNDVSSFMQFGKHKTGFCKCDSGFSGRFCENKIVLQNSGDKYFNLKNPDKFDNKYNQKSNSDLGVLAICLISCGSVLVFIILVGGGFFFYWYNKKQRQRIKESEAENRALKQLRAAEKQMIGHSSSDTGSESADSFSAPADDKFKFLASGDNYLAGKKKNPRNNAQQHGGVVAPTRDSHVSKNIGAVSNIANKNKSNIVNKSPVQAHLAQFSTRLQLSGRDNNDSYTPASSRENSPTTENNCVQGIIVHREFTLHSAADSSSMHESNTSEINFGAASSVSGYSKGGQQSKGWRKQKTAESFAFSIPEGSEQ
eukprot:gene745-466_t